MTPELKEKVYKTTCETWRYEVDSYWQRNNYFAAFETVALAGCWYVVEHCYLRSGLAFAVLGTASTVVWLITSIAVHRYIDYWWKSIHHAEHVLSLDECGLDFATKHPGSRLHPSVWVHAIPCLFMVAWILIASLAIHGMCSCRPCLIGTP